MNGNFGDLVERGYVETLGQGRYTVTRAGVDRRAFANCSPTARPGRYTVTRAGVDRLIDQTESLADFTEYVEREIIETVDAETGVVTGSIDPGDRVSLSLEREVLEATPGEGSASAGAVAVTAAEAGQDVGVKDFEGPLEYDSAR